MKIPFFHNTILVILIVFSSCATSEDLTCIQNRKRVFTEETNAKVLLIGMDGCRSDALHRASTPNLDQLVDQGAFSFETKQKSYAKDPNWPTMLTGVWGDKPTTISSFYLDDRYKQYPHFFNRIRKYERCTDLVAILRHLPSSKAILAGLTKHKRSSDSGVANKAKHLLKKENAPDVLFLQFEQILKASQTDDFSVEDEAYIMSIEKTDQLIGKLLEQVQKREQQYQENWLVVVSTEYGNYFEEQPTTADSATNKPTPLILYGQGVAPGPILPSPEIVDVVPTILRHLEIPLNPEWNLDGKVVGME